jgi:hypothetical protein
MLIRLRLLDSGGHIELRRAGPPSLDLWAKTIKE